MILNATGYHVISYLSCSITCISRLHMAKTCPRGSGKPRFFKKLIPLGFWGLYWVLAFWALLWFFEFFLCERAIGKLIGSFSSSAKLLLSLPSERSEWRRYCFHSVCLSVCLSVCMCVRLFAADGQSDWFKTVQSHGLQI